MTWLDKIPMNVLVVVAVLLTLAPLFPEPHLWQKLNMLFTGNLVKAIDIIDLFIHGTPITLLAIKLVRKYK